jgi:hypothetical protein
MITNQLVVGTGVNIRGRVILQLRSDREAMDLGHVTIVPGNQTAEINPDGTWMIANVAPGTYSLFANAFGYLASQIDDVVVGSSDVLIPDTTLELGDVNGDGVVSILDISGVASNFGRFEPRAWEDGGPAPDTGIGIPATATPHAAATATPAVPSGPQGHVVRAMKWVDSIYGVGYIGPYRGSAHDQVGGIEETMFVFNNSDPMPPKLATDWEMDPAGTKVTIGPP